MEKFNLLILNGDLPVFPGWGAIEYLHTTGLAKLGHTVGLVSMVHTAEQGEKKSALIGAGVALYLWENPVLREQTSHCAIRRTWVRRVGKAIYCALRTWPRRPRDILDQDLAFANLAGPILQGLSDHGWHALIVVQSQCARWVDYLPRFQASILMMHDVRALLYGRRARVAESMAKRITWSMEGWLYRRFERKHCRKYDLVVTVSTVDAAWVRQYYSPARTITIPIPVDGDYFRPLPGVKQEQARILFTGMMNHPPNVDAADFFARHVFPRVQAAVPEAEFWIVGRDPTPRVQVLASLPGIVVTGVVPDIRPLIAQATVVVVPLRFGSGMRQKILEAWAMEKCVVSTCIGAEGLDYKDGENILIADDEGTMADSVIHVIRNPSPRDRIRGQGRALILNQHHPEKLARQYLQAIACVVREKRQRAGPMRVVIDLRWMQPGVAGGIENLARSFLSYLLQMDGFNRYTILVPAETRYDFDLRAHPNFSIIAADTPSRYFRQFLWWGARCLHRRLRIPYLRSHEVESLRRAHALDAEISLSIPGYIHSDLRALANVLIVPDIQHEYFPQFFSPSLLSERRRIYADSIRRANHVCAISEFTRQTLIDRLGIPADRVTTVHLAADPVFHPHSPYRGNSALVLRKYGLKRGEYLYFPGNTWPHKNHQVAVKALGILRDEYGLEPLLVCTGSAKEAHAGLLKLIQDLKLDGRVRFLGYCPTADMPALYEGAAGLVFPSLYEGFGIPVLEAMWCDCPIVCSNATSLPEIVGDAALLVNPHAPAELACAITRVLKEEALRRALIERGRIQVRKYSWLKFTAEIVRILHEVRKMRFE